MLIQIQIAVAAMVWHRLRAGRTLLRVSLLFSLCAVVLISETLAVVGS